MVVLQVFPEEFHQVVGELLERGVVQAGAVLGEVGDQQVTHRSAGRCVLVHEFLDAELVAEAAVEHAQGGRRVGREVSERVKELVETPSRMAGAFGLALVAQFDQLQAVPDGDIGDGAALGGQNHGDLLGSVAALVETQPCRGGLHGERGEAARIAQARDLPAQGEPDRAGHEPGHRWA